MPKRKTIPNITLFMLFLLLFPSLLLAQMEEYKDYTIVKGDTLWDISKKELNDSFLWPKIWKENPDIANPDRIYPNQKIKIPLYILPKEIPVTEVPETKVEIKKEPEKEIAEKIEPVRKEYLVDRDLLIASGYITDSIPGVGSIVGSPSGRNLLGKDDYAYIKTESPAKIGEKFYIIQSLGKVTHPKTGLMLGYLIEILGIVQVVGKDIDDTKAKIVASYIDIPTGSLLTNYYEVEQPLAIKDPRKPDIDGHIVATRQLRTLTGMWDVVYIDKGKTRGLEVGDVLSTTPPGKPGVINGMIQVINPKELTATAVVRKSSEEITRGGGVTGLK